MGDEYVQADRESSKSPILKIVVIILFVFLILGLIGLYGYYLYDEKGVGKVENFVDDGELCHGMNLGACDKSCNSVSDCAIAMNCGCFNKKDADKIAQDEDGFYINWHLCGPNYGENCLCKNNECIREMIE